MIKMDEPNTSSNVPGDKEEDRQHMVLSDDGEEDDDDALEEGEAKLRSIHFLHQKKESSLGGDNDGDGDVDNDGERTDVSSRRYDEMASFLTRSQRSIEMPDPKPTEEELEQRRVQVQEEPREVHESEPMSAEEVKAYYMGDEDFRRVDVDVELTTMRWEKAQKVRCSVHKWDVQNIVSVSVVWPFLFTK